MIKLLFKITHILLTLGLLTYVAIPSQEFPTPPSDALQSFEPADTETPLRRAYFTHLNREEVMAHYKAQFSSLPTINLNYPPEEAQTIIRDQTRSSYLEELVHPFRESIFINGFVPKEKKDAILIEGQEYYQKITVRSVPSLMVTRIVFVLLSSMFSYVLIMFVSRIALDFVKWGRGFIKSKI